MSTAIVMAQAFTELRAGRTPSELVVFPEASSMPPGAVLLSLSGPERSDLKGAVLVAALSLFGAGFGLGYWRGSR